MILDRSTIVRTSAAMLLGVTAATGAGAQERGLFTLNTTVDREVLVIVRGRDVQVRGTGLDASYRPRLDVREGVPRTPGEVLVRRTDGRGTVQVIEQPSPGNNYTTTIRITDAAGGSDSYALLASWRPTGDYGNGGYGNGNGDYDRNRNDGRYDPRDRRDDDRNNRGRDDDRYDNRGRNAKCDHPNRSNGRGRDDDKCNDRNRRDNDRWDDRNDRDNRGNRNDNGMLRWSGNVDDVSEIVISGRRVQYRTRSGAPIRNARYDMRGAPLPNRPVNVTVGVQQGRGNVYVVQQPTRSNNYTAIIRVSDQRSGYGMYDFDVAW